MINKEIGLRIRKQRELLGYTREELAEKLNVSPKFCADIEHGTKGMSTDTLCKLSKELLMSTDYILFELCNDDKNSEIENLINLCSSDKKDYLKNIIFNFIKASQ